MIVLVHSGTPEYRFVVIDATGRHEFSWQADRTLAKGILAFTEKCFESLGVTWDDLEGIGVCSGPGSFTGLRIGLTVWNTVADTRRVPIVGASGDTWEVSVLERLKNGENDQLVMPEYDSDAHITTPRK